MKVPVFVPQQGSYAESAIAKGSAIVGTQKGDSGWICYYEGNLYNAENITSFEDKAMIAAGRMRDNYPTFARMFCTDESLIHVGEFDCNTNTFIQNQQADAMMAFHAWTVKEVD